jgi:hypothetical protein
MDAGLPDWSEFGAMCISIARGWLKPCLCLATSFCLAAPALAQSQPETISLELSAGRTMRVALDHRVTVRKAGQPITRTLVESVYVYYRIVLPIGTRLAGRIERLDEPSKTKRAIGMIGGDFSPHPVPVLRFDSILDQDGQPIPIVTVVKGGTLRAKPQVAHNPTSSDEEEKTARIQQAKEAISAQAHEALALLKDQISKVAQQRNIVIYAIGLFGHVEKSKAARAALDHLAERSGGMAYYPSSLEDIDGVARDIAHQIRNQYTLAYSPLNQALDGTYRTIQVKVTGRERYYPRTRTGYLATP